MYITKPMMTMDEWTQFLNAMLACVDTHNEDGMEALCVPMREKMERAGYKDFFSYLQACIRGEEW